MTDSDMNLTKLVDIMFKFFVMLEIMLKMKIYIYHDLNYSHQIKRRPILDNVGLLDIRIQHDTVAINCLVIKQCIINIYKQTWYTRLCNVNSKRSYSDIMCNTELKMEN